MAELIMKGAPVVAAMKEKMTEQVEALKAKGVEPCLTIIRVGARPDDLAYERGARKRMESVGIKLAVAELPEDVSQNLLEQTFYKLNEDPNVHGIMLPSDFSTLSSVQDAVDLAENLGIGYDVVPISEIYHKFMKTLDGLGVKKIETENADFNTDVHEAVAMVPGMGDDKKGKVIDCLQAGYQLNDKVIRHAKVAVGQ